MLDSMLDMSAQCPRWIVVKETTLAHICWYKYILELITDHFHYLVSLVDLVDEYGNPIWKNRVESWKEKDKKKKKKKEAPKVEHEDPVPQELDMEEKQLVQQEIEQLSQVING